MLADKRYCYPLTITDFASRYLIGCEALSCTKEIYAFSVFERVFRRVYATRDRARADLFDYVERFYNPRRRHSTIDYLSPVEYENTRNSA